MNNFCFRNQETHLVKVLQVGSFRALKGVLRHPPSNDCEQPARLGWSRSTVVLYQVSVHFYCFFVFRFMMPEGESGVLCFMHISLRIYFLVLVIWRPSHEHLFCNRTPKALIARDHSKTSRKLKSAQSFEIQIRYQMGSLSDPWLFCSGNKKNFCRLLFKLDLNNFASPAVFEKWR